MPRILVALPVFTAGAMAGTNTITSNPINIQAMPWATIVASWTGTPVGTFSLEISNDWDNQKQTGKWTAVTLSGSGAPSGAVGDTSFNIGPVGTSWIRLKYTNTSGTGVLTATASGKGF